MANSNIYKVNWNRLISWNLPQRMLTSNNFHWLKGLLSPLVTLYFDFLKYKSDVEFRVVTNGQVCVLRGALNARFDKTRKRITITKGNAEKLYVYTIAENRPVYLPQYLALGGGNFIVNIPYDLIYQESDIRLLIDLYKRPTKTYTINYV